MVREMRFAIARMKSSKLQHPSSREAPMTNIQTVDLREGNYLIGCVGVGAWSLEFLWSLELGIYSFNATA
jgi:hypothetical protein